MKFDLKKFSMDMRVKAAELRIKGTQVGEAVGCSQATISRIMREASFPDVENFGKCCKWMGKPMEDYFTE